MPDQPLSPSALPPGWREQDENLFRRWYAKAAEETGIDRDPDNPEHKYNYRYAFKAGAWPNAEKHWPSTFKAADHPNRFVDGQDTITGLPAVAPAPKPQVAAPAPKTAKAPARAYTPPPEKKYSPTQVVAAYRQAHPGLLDKYDDKDLLDAIQQADPDTYALVDPGLIGTEVLTETRQGIWQAPVPQTYPAKTPAAAPPPVPPQLPLGDRMALGASKIIPPAIRLTGTIGGATLAAPFAGAEVLGGITAPAAPLTVAAGGAAGSALAEGPAQWAENKLGLREGYSGTEALVNTGLGAFNPAARGETLLGKAAWQAAYGGGASAAGTTAQSLLDRGEVPSAGELATSTAYGTGAGLLLGTGAAMLHLRAQARAEEAAKNMRNLWEGAYQSDHDLTTLQKGKFYLDEMAAGMEPPPPPPAPPPAPPAPKLLPQFAGPDAGPPIQAFPPGVDPNAIDVVAPGGRPIIANEPPSEPIEELLHQSLQAAPGAPRLRPGEAPPALALHAPPAPPGVTQEVQPSLRQGYGAGKPIQPPRTDQAPIQQIGELGGAPPSPDQPPLPHVYEGRPAAETREYPSGPNVNPRRQGEAHQAPRTYKILNKRTRKMVTQTSGLPAEDPGMYPPEVRREMAVMAEELHQFPFEGNVLILPDASTYRRMEDAPTRISNPGAPVYHDVKAYVEGNLGREDSGAARTQVLRAIEDAIQDGKGSLISDAAAQVARDRLAGKTRRQLPEGYGDHRIGWQDEAGPAAHPFDPDPLSQSIREASDQEIKSANDFIREQGGLEGVEESQREFFRAAQAEGVRRGFAKETQGELIMEAPGAPGKLSVRAPKEPPSLFGEEQPSLPGTEGVREQNIPTPEVAEAPFALTPPPAPKSLPPRSAQGGLFDRLSREEGMFVFRKPANDRKSLQAFLKQQEKDHGTEPWFVRAEQAIASKDWDRAWQIVGHASTRSVVKARAAALPHEQAAIDQMLRGTPFQDDLPAQLVTKARQRAGVGTAPPIPTVTAKGPGGTFSEKFPPSPKVTQAGAARGNATLGPAGILNPGPPKRPLSAAAPALRANVLDPSVLREVVAHTSPEGKAIIPGNRDANLRIGRQVVEDMYLGKNLESLREAGVTLSDEELAQYGQQTFSQAGRTLNLLSQFVQQNQEQLGEEAERMSFGGALRGLLPGWAGGEAHRITPTAGAGGRKLGKEAQEVLQAIDDVNPTLSANLAANTLQPRPKVGLPRAVHDLSYIYMLSRPATASRNYLDATGRYSVDSFVHALTVPWAKLTAPLTGDYALAGEAAAQFKERGFGLQGKDTAVSPSRAMQDTVQGIWNLTEEAVNAAPGSSAKHTLKLLADLPEMAAHFIGMTRGEDIRTSGLGEIPGLKYLANEKVLKVLSLFQNMQELSKRAHIYNATMRAQVRAAGHDPTTLLLQPTDTIKQALGERTFGNMVTIATQTALEQTYAGGIAKDSVPGAVIHLLQTAWPLKLGIPFPRFNFSAGPRWIADHEPLMGVYEVLRHGTDLMLSHFGIGAGGQYGGRLTRGVRARHIEQHVLPQVLQKQAEAESRVQSGLQTLAGLGKELGAAKRLVTRLEKTPGAQNLEGASPLQEAIDARDTLQAHVDKYRATWNADRTLAMDLAATAKKHLETVGNAHAINAPTYAQFLARQTAGMGLLGAAILLRSQDAAKGTDWYRYPVEHDGKTYTVDFRAFPGLSHFMFVGDVIHDIAATTDWQGYQRARDAGDSATDAWWANYEGKYTRTELGKQLAQALLSISRPAGTTLSLVDLATRNGYPGVEELLQATIGTIGQFAARFSVPIQPIRDVIGSMVPEEKILRTQAESREGSRFAPLWQPTASNFPGAQRLLRPSIDQLTGEAKTRTSPLMSTFGLGYQEQSPVQTEIKRTGVPGSTVYIRSTGDAEVDQITAEEYGKVLQEYFPQVLESEGYKQADSPATQRDFHVKTTFPVLKSLAIAKAMERVGLEKWDETHLRGEARRTKERQMRLLERLGQDPDVDQTPPPEDEDPIPEPVGTPPPVPAP